MSFWSVPHFSTLKKTSGLPFTQYDMIFSITCIACLEESLFARISTLYENRDIVGVKFEELAL